MTKEELLKKNKEFDMAIDELQEKNKEAFSGRTDKISDHIYARH
ncbi:MAG: hypothetical protein WKF35_13315 [Ferruginibacter sp.]